MKFCCPLDITDFTDKTQISAFSSSRILVTAKFEIHISFFFLIFHSNVLYLKPLCLSIKKSAPNCDKVKNNKNLLFNIILFCCSIEVWYFYRTCTCNTRNFLSLYTESESCKQIIGLNIKDTGQV